MSQLSVVSETDRQRYRERGVVALRGVLSADIVNALAAPVARAVAGPDTVDLSALGDALTGTSIEGGDRGRFRSGVDHWRTDEDMAAFALTSPLPAIVAQLLEASKLSLYEDSILVKEPNSREPTMFHQDHPYFSVVGEQVCTTWIPLDQVTRETGGIGYVVGSHLDDTEWRPNLFVTRDPIPGATGRDVPDYHIDDQGREIEWVEATPGDVVVHHSRTLHGAGPNRSATQARRAVSVRYCGDGVTFSSRAVTPKPHHESMAEGEPLHPPAFPIAWPPPAE